MPYLSITLLLKDLETFLHFAQLAQIQCSVADILEAIVKGDYYDPAGYADSYDHYRESVVAEEGDTIHIYPSQSKV